MYSMYCMCSNASKAMYDGIRKMLLTPSADHAPMRAQRTFDGWVNRRSALPAVDAPRDHSAAAAARTITVSHTGAVASSDRPAAGYRSASAGRYGVSASRTGFQVLRSVV